MAWYRLASSALLPEANTRTPPMAVRSSAPSKRLDIVA